MTPSEKLRLIMRTSKTAYRFFAALTAMLLPSLALAQDDLNGANTAILTVILLKLVAALTGGLRVDGEQEQQGLDISDHDEKGYSM